MGCGAAKEAVEEPADQQQHHEPKKDREKEEVAVEAIDDRPPLTKSQIFEIFNAGSVKPNVPPLYMPLDAGPFVTREKVPSQTHSSGRFLVSGDVAPARQVDDAAAAALRSPTLHLDNDGVLLRAYFPHSLSGYCVGQCRPDLSAGQLLPGFRYDVEVEGAMDERAIALSKPVAREPSQRRRVLLFPATIDAVGLFVTVDGATKTTRVVAPYNGTCATAPEVEPIEGAFATYSMMTHSSNQDHDNQSLISASPRTVAPALPTRHSKREIGAVLTSSSTIYTETSLGFTLLPSPRPIAKPDAVGDTVERRLPEDAVTPARSVGALGHIPAARRGSLHSGVEAAFAEALCGLDDGAHTVQLSLRFRYATDSFVAVYDKPAPVAGTTGLRIVGSYIAHTISSSAADQLSETIAMGDCTIMMDSNGRAHLTDMCRSQH